jgi:hypothetical protein
MLLQAAAVRDDDGTEADEHLLRQYHIDSSGPGLVAFFRDHSLTSSDLRAVQCLVAELGSDSFSAREEASRRLVQWGHRALVVLKGAIDHADGEVARRARYCIEEIERGPGPLAFGAAVRALRRRNPPGAAQTLLAYVPFCDDDALEDEVLDALYQLYPPPERSRAVFLAALESHWPATRAAAAYILGCLGNPEDRARVRLLLADIDPKLRLRAAQGLATHHEKDIVPVLIELLNDAPITLGWQAEDLLHHLAGPHAPAITLADGNARARMACRDAWNAWQHEHADAIDWRSLEDHSHQLGLTVIVEMDRNRVWECGPDGKTRWKIENLQGPMDAQVLATGRVLIAENLGQRVTERDQKGNILWERRIDENPIACQRLANGNTFIVSYQSLLEVDREGKETFRHSRGPSYWIFSAHKRPDGNIVFVSGQGSLVELDPSGKEILTFPVNERGGWCSVEGLGNGNFLVAISAANRIVELSPSGKVVWQTSVASPYSATRLPNGNTLVASMSLYRVVEIDGLGKPVWEKTTDSRPFRAHRR